MNAKKLIDLWLNYARDNGIAAGKQEGRPAEDTDLIEFLSRNGFSEDLVKPIIDALPDATPAEPTPAEPNKDIKIRTGTRNVASDKELYVWAGQRWLNDKTLKPATQDITDELNARELERTDAEKDKEETAARSVGDSEANAEKEQKNSPKAPESKIGSDKEEKDAPVEDPGVSSSSDDDSEKDQDTKDKAQRQTITPKQAEYLNRIKKVLRNMNDEQIRQLRRELK